MQTLQNMPFTRFHGGNTGSNPVGDAKKTKGLARIPNATVGPKTSNKDFYTSVVPFPAKRALQLYSVRCA